MGSETSERTPQFRVKRDGNGTAESVNFYEERKAQLIKMMSMYGAAVNITYGSTMSIKAIELNIELTPEQRALIDKYKSRGKLLCLGTASGVVNASVSEPKRRLLLVASVKKDKHGNIRQKQPHFELLSAVVDFILADSTSTTPPIDYQTEKQTLIFKTNDQLRR